VVLLKLVMEEAANFYIQVSNEESLVSCIVNAAQGKRTILK